MADGAPTGGTPPNAAGILQALIRHDYHQPAGERAGVRRLVPGFA